MILLKDIFSVKVFLIPVSHIDDGSYVVDQKILTQNLQDHWKINISLTMALLRISGHSVAGTASSKVKKFVRM